VKSAITFHALFYIAHNFPGALSGAINPTYIFSSYIASSEWQSWLKERSHRDDGSAAHLSRIPSDTLHVTAIKSNHSVTCFPVPSLHRNLQLAPIDAI
jgi:hypothetical protein